MTPSLREMIQKKLIINTWIFMRPLFLLIPLTLATMCKFNYSKLAYCRLRVVPHFSSGIVERAKRERAWKLTHARKGDTRKGERKMCRLFLRGLIFTRVLLGLLSLRKNGGLLVVYACCAKKVYSSNYMYSGSGFFSSKGIASLIRQKMILYQVQLINIM